MPSSSPQQAQAFIARWRASGASERSNYQMFLSELAELLGQPRPDPARGTPELDGYCFDRPVPFRDTGSTGMTAAPVSAPPISVSRLRREVARATLRVTFSENLSRPDIFVPFLSFRPA